MASYSFLNISASLAGIGGVIDLGYGAEIASEGITISMNQDKNSMMIGADGAVVHSLHAGKSGTVSVKLLKTSPANNKLSVMYNLQTQSSTTHGNNVIYIRNSGGNDVCVCREVAFKKHADLVYAEEADIVEWIFDAGKVDIVLGTY